MKERPFWEKPKGQALEDIKWGAIITVALAASIFISTEVGKALDDSPKKPINDTPPVPGASRPAEAIPQNQIVFLKK